jgi:hypothetical protein
MTKCTIALSNGLTFTRTFARAAIGRSFDLFVTSGTSQSDYRAIHVCSVVLMLQVTG